MGPFKIHYLIGKIFKKSLLIHLWVISSILLLSVRGFHFFVWAFWYSYLVNRGDGIRGMEGGISSQCFGLSAKSGFYLTYRGITWPKSMFHLAKSGFNLAKIGVSFVKSNTEKRNSVRWGRLPRYIYIYMVIEQKKKKGRHFVCKENYSASEKSKKGCQFVLEGK